MWSQQCWTELRETNWIVKFFECVDREPKYIFQSGTIATSFWRSVKIFQFKKRFWTYSLYFREPNNVLQWTVCLSCYSFNLLYHRSYRVCTLHNTFCYINIWKFNFFKINTEFMTNQQSYNVWCRCNKNSYI